MEPEYEGESPFLHSFHAKLNNQSKHKKYKEYTGTGRRGPPPRDPFVSWRGNEPKTKPAGWTKFAAELHQSQVLSKKKWIELLQARGMPITGITAAGMSLLAGWEDEGIDVALSKAAMVFAANPRTKKFGHSKHIMAAAANNDLNQSHNARAPPQAVHYLMAKSTQAKERHAALDARNPGWADIRKAFSLSPPLYKKLWKTIKAASLHVGIQAKMVKVTTQAESFAANGHINDIFRSVYNRDIRDMLSAQPERGILITQKDGNVGIRIYSPQTILKFIQFANNTDAIALVAYAAFVTGNNVNGVKQILSRLHDAVGANVNAVRRVFRRLNRAFKKQPRTDAFEKQLNRGVLVGKAISSLFNETGDIKGGGQFVTYAAMKDKAVNQNVKNAVGPIVASIVSGYPED